jgi:flagellar M-ring protein FliF
LQEKLRPKNPNVSAEMLDTANTYDDKVSLIRLLVADDAKRVANVLKQMISTA